MSICSYRVFVNVPAVRENERGLGAASRTAGDQRAAVPLISLPYVVSIGAAERPCPPCTGGKETFFSMYNIPTYIYSGSSNKVINLTSNRGAAVASVGTRQFLACHPPLPRPPPTRLSGSFGVGGS